ncbi:pepsin/retropepsin-like aspartic protease family protein [Phenylobacterium sp. J367]|uniref:pepsin/retropepsin-like aspartic protease family protein n=1 Tax=Phenylobacterium sp. J367 TaxID=2898435 RepID=UPI0021513F45|nr:pepsin/retropepsin-like aspartic protease family protein [Phenylobacterium sp. J367]MCR5877843.1 aspartyl protease family protein [Phenylobacterium sp. J367]
MNRRALLGQLGLLAAGGAGVWLLRERLAWPAPELQIAGGGPGTDWLPLPEAGGMIDLPARVGGRAIRAVLDSGAQYSAIDAGLAGELGLPPGSPVPMLAFGATGGPQMTRSVRLDLDIASPEGGALKLTGLRAATLDLHPLARLTRRPFSMLLGRDLLRAVVAEVDFPRARARFWRQEAWTPGADWRAATVRRGRAHALMAEVQVENAPPLEVMIDTGATGALALSETAAGARGLLGEGRRVRTARSVTLGGLSQDRLIRADAISFAGHRFEDEDVQVFTPAANAPIPDGLMGLGLLGRFRVALDHARGRLFLMGPYDRPARRTRRVRITPQPGIVED